MRYQEFLPQTFKIILMGSILFFLVSSISQFSISNYFPIKTVRVYGLNRLDQKEVQHVIYPLVNRGFFSINVERIRDRLKQLSWVSELYVRRIWPDQVVITLTEKTAIARWNENTLLSKNGELFSPRLESWPHNLPQFAGPDGQQVFMLKNFDNMNRLFAPLHASISHLELTPYLTWKLKLDNGITMQIGHKDILTRLNQFVKVYPKIVGVRTNDVDYIDLRYPNGVAVRYKEMG